MSFDTYANLQTEIGAWLKRTGMAAATIQGFISLAEKDMNKTLRTRNQEKRRPLTLSARYTDITTLSTDTVNEIRDIRINTDPIRDLEYRTPHQLNIEAPSLTPGKPYYYTLNGNELEVRPVPDSSYTAEATFYTNISQLSASNTTNWILTNHPNLYLWGALYYGNLYIENPVSADTNKTLFDQEIEKLNRLEKKARYSGSPLMQRTSTGNP